MKLPRESLLVRLPKGWRQDLATIAHEASAHTGDYISVNAVVCDIIGKALAERDRESMTLTEVLRAQGFLRAFPEDLTDIGVLP